MEVEDGEGYSENIILTQGCAIVPSCSGSPSCQKHVGCGWSPAHQLTEALWQVVGAWQDNRQCQTLIFIPGSLVMWLSRGTNSRENIDSILSFKEKSIGLLTVHCNAGLEFPGAKAVLVGIVGIYFLDFERSIRVAIPPAA